MRPFFELLPYRIEQAVGRRTFRAARVWFSRLSSAAADTSSHGRRRLFIDLAVISQHDAGTGIQRVVREIAYALLDTAPAQWDIQFVSAGIKKGYYQISWPDGAPKVEGAAMRAQPGDVFLGLDYSLDAIRRHRRQLARFRRNGGRLWFLIHDLLPLHRPEWFSSNTVLRYRAWLGILAGLADGFLCNSSQTEIELRSALAETYSLVAGYRTQVLPMGYVITGRPAGSDTPEAATIAARLDRSIPYALMVGTLEPRKGHAEVVAAFDALWKAGGNERLVLVGRLGWQVEALSEVDSGPSAIRLGAFLVR